MGAVAHLHLGTAKAIVTPPLGSAMAGYSHRTHGAESVLDDLEVRLFWFEASERAACIVTADIIGFAEYLTSEVRRRLSDELGIDPAAVLLAASHTHSGPHTCENVAEFGGPPDPKYIEELIVAIVGAARRAKESVRPVTMRIGRGALAGYAINRRRLEAGQASMRPNPTGVRDDEVTVLAFHDALRGELVGVLFHFTCHPTILGTYEISSEYPGAARRFIERKTGAVAGFLPGCFGDVRPACTTVGGQYFRRGTPQDIEAFGHALGEEVVRVVMHAYEEKRGRPASLFATTTEVKLPLAQEPEAAALTLQRLDLYDDVSLVAMGGEICVEYGHFIKELRPGLMTLPVGYANGMVGYIPTANMFEEGGYEPIDSVVHFGLPSPFKPELEARLHEALRSLFQT